jgi:lipopolysaccharide export system ATP-binding protein
MYKRAQMGIGYLPQEASVFRKLSVEDNIMAVLEMTKLNKQERLEKLETLLDEFNLHHVRKNNGDSLSGGERRRTEIARALAVDPKFILLDEPFAGVDPIAVEDIQTVVAKLKYKNIGILITDHNVNETLSICDRAYLLIEGKIFKHGTAEELAANEQVKRLYLGTNFELKRKDWIIELGMKNKKTPSLSSIIRSLESLEEHSDKILKANLGSLLSRKSLSTKLEDLKVDDFVSLYNSTKLFLVKWSNERSESDLKTLINQLPSLNESDFEQASFLLHGSHIESYGLDLDVAGIINYFNYERTDGKLQLLKSHLGLIKLRINALNNSN